MAAYDYDLGILGGGAAGLTAAAGSAQFGAKTILVEKAKKLGGDCLHFGCVPSKTLIRTAGVWSLAHRAKEFGLPEVALPPVSLAAVMARVRSVIDTIQEHDSPERFCRLGAAVRFGNPGFVDDHTVSVDGDRLTASAWIVPKTAFGCITLNSLPRRIFVIEPSITIAAKSNLPKRSHARTKASLEPPPFLPIRQLNNLLKSVFPVLLQQTIFGKA